MLFNHIPQPAPKTLTTMNTFIFCEMKEIVTNLKNQRLRFSSLLNFADKRMISAWVRKVVVAIVIGFSVVGCVSKATPTEIVSPTSITSCFPDTVFTAEDMRARVDCHPDDYKIEMNDDTVVLFAFPDPLLDWVGPIFIIHIPSVSEVVLDTEGNILFDGYKSSAGRQAIENVLNDPKTITSILERAKEIKERQ